MRIAIFHNYLDNIGGAEVVVLTLAKELGADVYSCAADTENIRKMGFDVPVHVIGDTKGNPPMRRQIASTRFRHLNLTGKYDLFIIGGDWAISGTINNKPNLWYAHTPIRELWDMYGYVRENVIPDGRIIKNANRYMFDIWVRYNRILNKRYVRHTDKIVCNSKTVQERIAKYYNRDATIVYPPVDTKKFHFESTGDYWLSVNRMILPKRVELQTEAFKLLPDEKLVIVGSYEDAAHFHEYRHYIERIKPDNVTLCSHVHTDELIHLYANCKGFITTAREEDFGLTAIEAMASGKAVIAPKEGGYRESVVDGKTGILIEDIDPEKIASAVREINKDPERYKAAALARAQQFDTGEFVKKMKQVIGL